MYLKKSLNKKTGRTYLSIATGYRDKNTGKSKTVLIESLGYLDVLEKEFEDPISHFSKIVEEMNKAVEDMNRSKGQIDSLIALCDNTLAEKSSDGSAQ